MTRSSYFAGAPRGVSEDDDRQAEKCGPSIPELVVSDCFGSGAGVEILVSCCHFMREISSNNFGLLIAFVLPGFTALWGASYLSPELHSWLVGADASGPTVGGFLYVTLASVACGLTVSTVRWATIDRIHHYTGLSRPRWDFSRLQEHFAAYKMLHEFHYQFYQFNSNALISLLFVFVARRIHLGLWTAAFGWFDSSLLLLAVILYIGSRDTLRNYHLRVSDLLGSRRVERMDREETGEDAQILPNQVCSSMRCSCLCASGLIRPSLSLLANAPAPGSPQHISRTGRGSRPRPICSSGRSGCRTPSRRPETPGP